MSIAIKSVTAAWLLVFSAEDEAEALCYDGSFSRVVGAAMSKAKKLRHDAETLETAYDRQQSA